MRCRLSTLLAGKGIKLTVYPMKPYTQEELTEIKNRLTSSDLVSDVIFKVCKSSMVEDMNSGKIEHYHDVMDIKQPSEFRSLDEVLSWLTYYIEKSIKVLFSDTIFYVNNLDELYSLFSNEF